MGKRLDAFYFEKLYEERILQCKQLLTSAHPEMANLPDIGVAQKIESSEYQPYASGSIFCAP
jgi:hypothetical protein